MRWNQVVGSRGLASKLFMKIDRGLGGWSAMLLGAAGLTYATVHLKRRSEALRKLKGKVVLVTGGSRGLGFAIARELASGRPVGAYLASLGSAGARASTAAGE